MRGSRALYHSVPLTDFSVELFRSLLQPVTKKLDISRRPVRLRAEPYDPATAILGVRLLSHPAVLHKSSYGAADGTQRDASVLMYPL